MTATTASPLSREEQAIQAELARIVRDRATGAADDRTRRYVVLSDHVEGWAGGDLVDLTDEEAIELLRDHAIAPRGRKRP